MRTSIALLLLPALLLPSGEIWALSGEKYRAIQNLGVLNGVALQCKYLDETRKMKLALIRVLPKRRALGQAFELATNDAFLEFIENGAACPRKIDFSARVDEQIKSLNKAFATGGKAGE